MKGAIHGDLKPANVIIGHDREPYVLDFDAARTGVSRPFNEPMFRSIPWLAPEQARSQPELISTQTDVYSLGVILYHVVTGGRFPYAHLQNMMMPWRSSAAAK